MERVRLRLVTIIAEAVLEDRLLEAVTRLGARGYSLSEVQGEGGRGVRGARTIEFEGKNIKIETVVGPEVADRILEHLAAEYFEHYALITWVELVEVVRGDKYV